jgi:hypothetical protein
MHPSTHQPEQAMNLYAITITAKPRGKRTPVVSRYGVVAESKEAARSKFTEQYPAQIIETDVVTVEKYEDGICRLA